MFSFQFFRGNKKPVLKQEAENNNNKRCKFNKFIHKNLISQVASSIQSNKMLHQRGEKEISIPCLILFDGKRANLFEMYLLCILILSYCKLIFHISGQ